MICVVCLVDFRASVNACHILPCYDAGPNHISSNSHNKSHPVSTQNKHHRSLLKIILEWFWGIHLFVDSPIQPHSGTPFEEIAPVKTLVSYRYLAHMGVVKMNTRSAGLGSLIGQQMIFGRSAKQLTTPATHSHPAAAQALQSTVRPWESVMRPSSNSCRSTLSTSSKVVK